MFQVKNPRWADDWQQQASAVMLVISTSDGDIRWMDVSAYLKRESAGGTAARQIVFAGDRFDVMRVPSWRKKVLRSGSTGNEAHDAANAKAQRSKGAEKQRRQEQNRRSSIGRGLPVWEFAGGARDGGRLRGFAPLRL